MKRYQLEFLMASKSAIDGKPFWTRAAAEPASLTVTTRRLAKYVADDISLGIPAVNVLAGWRVVEVKEQ